MNIISVNAMIGWRLINVNLWVRNSCWNTNRMALQNVCYISKEVVNNFLCLRRSLFKSQRRFKWPSLVAYMQSFEISFRTRIGNFLALLSCHDSGKIIFGKNMLPQIYFLLMLLKKMKLWIWLIVKQRRIIKRTLMILNNMLFSSKVGKNSPKG